MSSLVTPLRPAGHLPLKGGDRFAALAAAILRRGVFSPMALTAKDDGRGYLGPIWGGKRTVLPISPLEGEMPGRAEGGNGGLKMTCQREALT